MPCGEIGLEPTLALLTKLRTIGKQLNALQVIGRQHYVTDEQFARITEERRQRFGDPTLSAAEVWSRNLSCRSRERERRQRLTRYVAVPDEPNDNAQNHAHASVRPKLKLLERALQDAGIQITKSYVKQMRHAAKTLNACYIIGRKCYVTDEQLARVLEAYRWQRGIGHVGVHQLWKAHHVPQLRGVRLTESPKERAKRLLDKSIKEAKERRKKKEGTRARQALN